MYSYVVYCDKNWYNNANLTLLVAKGVMIVIGWCAIVASLIILYRKGTNPTLRRLALRRQFTFLFLFSFWHTMFSIFFYDSNMLKKIRLSYSAVQFISIYLQVVGVPSAIMRATEPFILARLQSTFRSVLGMMKNRPERERADSSIRRAGANKRIKQELRDASICSFLNSTMNVEYVFFVLHGIEKLMANQ